MGDWATGRLGDWATSQQCNRLQEHDGSGRFGPWGTHSIGRSNRASQLTARAGDEGLWTTKPFTPHRTPWATQEHERVCSNPRSVVPRVLAADGSTYCTCLANGREILKDSLKSQFNNALRHRLIRRLY